MWNSVSNGTKGSTASKGGKVTVDNSAATEEDGYYQYLGTTSLKVENPTSENNSAFFTGFAHQFKETTFNGKDVTFSAYVKTENVKQIYSGGSVGAILKVKCLDSSGKTVKEINSIGLTGTLDWQRISVTANVPSTTASIRVYGLIRYASGTAWFDCIQFEEGNCANNFNALQNSDFSSNDNWLTEENKSISANNGTVTIGGTAGAFDDSNIESSTEETTTESSTEPSTYTKTVTETAPMDSITSYDDYGNAIKSEQGFVTRTVKKTYEVESSDTSTDEDGDDTDDSTSSSSLLGNKYIYQNVKVDKAGVSFKINGTAKAESVPLSNENRTFGIALNIYYKNNSTPEMHYQEFNVNTSKNQQVSLSISPENSDETIDYVAFAFVYGYNENEMMVTNAELNILATGYVTKQSEDSKDDSSVSAGNESDDDTEVDDYVDYEVLSESVDKTKPFMQTSSEYDSTGNYVTAETNEQGSTTQYVYDVNGNVTSITDADDNVTSYAYDSSGNLISVKNGDSENSYTYSGLGSVSKITHNGFDYSFNYDVFYNLVSTKIGNVTVASHTYDSNGNLTKTAYANGDYLEYAYDNYGNISVITGETGKIAEMIYNKQGLVTKAVDYSSGETSYYYYTFDGSLESEYRTSSDGSLTHYIITDSNGNTVEKTSVNGQTKTITTGSDDDGKSFVSNDGITNETSTDDFGRVSTVTTKQNKSDTVFTKQYSYYHGSESNATTNMVGGISYKLSSDRVLDYSYNYNDTGNVENVYENGKKVAVYTYDELNQLVWYADTRTGRYIRIVYDNYGNIQKMESYSLGTNWAPVKLLETRTYSYGYTNWKDKLTEFDGDSITYDKNGNPLTYRDDMTFEWENGRILKDITTYDKAIQMSYDSNGMRTQKSVDGVKTNYYYDSSNNLFALTQGSDTLFFYYDNSGEVMSVSCNGTMYFYIKDLQGDITEIVDKDGKAVAEYAYDAWGNMLTENNGTLAVGKLNPFRYRSYVYDEETGLYYLQSRYYDPLTGRFLNADVYCDTQSGTPLSTNMFAYCENNSISSIDVNGYWDTPVHKKMANATGFKGKSYAKVREWVYKADENPYASNGYYSAPFHGRKDGLNIARDLYNIALMIKTNKKKYKFSFSKQKGCYVLPDRLKYTYKGNHKSIKNNVQRQVLINLNSLKDYKVQYSAFLGLALHTFQDYFAHCLYADVKKQTRTTYISGQTKITTKVYKSMRMFEIDDFMGLDNSQIEDNTSVFPWRYGRAKSVTGVIYNAWCNNKKIKSVSLVKNGKPSNYYRTTYGSYTPSKSVVYKWTITAQNYIVKYAYY